MLILISLIVSPLVLASTDQCCTDLTIYLYTEPHQFSEKNLFYLTDMDYNGKGVWMNEDGIYLFQHKGIWFISTKLGAMSGYAYSRSGETCPGIDGWTNHQGRIDGLLVEADFCSESSPRSGDVTSTTTTTTSTTTTTTTTTRSTTTTSTTTTTTTILTTTTSTTTTTTTILNTTTTKAATTSTTTTKLSTTTSTTTTTTTTKNKVTTTSETTTEPLLTTSTTGPSTTRRTLPMIYPDDGDLAAYYIDNYSLGKANYSIEIKHICI